MKELIHFPDMGTWSFVPGTESVRMQSFSPSTEDDGCTCYLLETQDYIIGIDPGLPEPQIQNFHSLLRDLIDEKKRPVSLFYTHWRDGIFDASLNLGADIALHATALCHAFAQDDPPEAQEFFQRFGNSTGLFCGHGSACVYRSLLTPAGELEALAIPLTADAGLQIYQTPGQQSCAISLRVKHALFIGNLLGEQETQAHAGPDSHIYRQTLGKMVWIIEQANVTEVLPAYGPRLTADEAVRRMQARMGK